ncbi:MAG: type II toxin-antitoxin system VapC family toxin [Syntrophobacterales bacterium]
MILVDANVLMYAAGAAHRHKAASVSFLERVASGEVEAALDAEVLQEVLHRYRAIGRWKEGRKVYDAARRIFPVVLPVTAEVGDRARGLLDEYGRLMARDALHAAFVLEHGLDALCSFDRDFDRIEAVTRLEPGNVG